MNKQQVKDLFNSFNNLKVLVIGDVMIDAYYQGKVDRISPEAPVPVVRVTKSEKRLGGAANVARNLKSLGATPFLCSVIGEDLSGNEFLDILDQESMPSTGIIRSAERTTTVKTRVISGSQHMLRIDEEKISSLSNQELVDFENHIKNLIESEKIDVIIFEDYDKGIITASLIKAVVNYAHINDIPVAVDPKKDNFLNYKNVDLFKPNLKELVEGLKIEITTKSTQELNKANALLHEVLNHKNSLITLSEKGVFIGSKSQGEIIPAHFRNITDVSGAGDTVISVASLCLANNIESHWLAQFSNLAGGLVCEEVGVIPVNKQKLLDECLALCKA
ncbi:MAG: bifunctional heptose 7-phosphate kinase/heptose 1-phosphate adenyltransferase [Salibacteraceae bacterium]